jgi:hypothetical protein
MQRNKKFWNIQSKKLCHVAVKVELTQVPECYSNQQSCLIFSNSSNHFVACSIMESGFTQPVMSTMVVSWEKRRPVLRAENLPPSCAFCLEIQGASNFWSAKVLSKPVLGQLSTVYLVACSVDGATRTKNALRKKRDFLF